MTFEEALPRMRSGQKLVCDQWSIKDAWITIFHTAFICDEGEGVMIHTGDILEGNWSLYDGDLEWTDQQVADLDEWVAEQKAGKS